MGLKSLITLLLLTTTISAHADWFYVLVGYICDAKNDKLLLTYDGAYNEEGRAMVANKRKTQWYPWSLTIPKDEDHIGSLKTVHETCRLSDGVYDIDIFPSPGNFNIQGPCGAWITAGATVKKHNRTVYSIPGFERDCEDTDTPIVTRVAIRPGNKNPEVSTVKWNDFYK